MADPTLSPDTLAIIGTVAGTVFGTGGFLAVMFWRTASRLDADRREFQRAMDDFRKEMQRLAERQSHIEGRMRPAE